MMEAAPYEIPSELHALLRSSLVHIQPMGGSVEAARNGVALTFQAFGDLAELAFQVRGETVWRIRFTPTRKPG